jgi:hydroxymethylpyrimidine pyrophosphatase-like HAD family hydrolase
MQARFEALKGLKQKAFVFDIDGNLTRKVTVEIADGKTRVEAVLDEKIMEKLLTILQSGKKIVLITGRMTSVGEEVKNTGESDLESILEQFHSFVDEKVTDHEIKTKILKNIYLTSENGLGQTINGFRRTEPEFKRYDEEFFQKIMERKGWVVDPSKNEQLTKLMMELDFEGLKLASERMFKFRGDQSKLTEFRKVIIKEIREAGLWREGEMDVVLAGEVIDVLYYLVNKFSSLIFLEEELGIKDDDKGVIIKSGDNADPFGNDFPMVAQKFGMSSGKFDPFNPYMIALPLISGQEKGTDSTLWALEQLGV